MRVGFTGSRKGMTMSQHEQLARVLAWLRSGWQFESGEPLEFHHGNSPELGADQQAAAIAVRLGYTEYRHNPEDRSSSAMLQRNREIVQSIDILVAAPEYNAEKLRSGTWATVRYARAAGLPIVMLSR